jgi:hypothetical protein
MITGCREAGTHAVVHPTTARAGVAKGNPSRLRWLVALAALAGGCAPEVDVSYGDVRGPSINGVSAFVQLLRDSGRTVTARGMLPARAHGRYDAVILFVSSDDWSPLIAELVADPGPLTLLLAFHDGDAAGGYFRDLANRADLAPDVREEARRRLRSWESMVETQASTGRAATPPGTAAIEPCERQAAADAIDVEVRGASSQKRSSVRARWRLHRRLVPASEATVLWKTAVEPLLAETQLGADTALPLELLHELGAERSNGPSDLEALDAADGEPVMTGPRDRVLELVSATPLLNGGLVDPGNRALAEDLVARLPPAARVLVVGSSLVDQSQGEDGGEPSMLRLLSVPPLPWVAVQVVVALGLFCWWKSPIFGRPRRTPASLTQDFGHHVDALGTLLGRSGNAGEGGPDGRQLVEARLEEWRRLSASAVVGQARGRRP